MARQSIGDLYLRTARELPAGWILQGLRCTSDGLRPEQRRDGWLVEACGPEGGCVKIAADSPAEALLALSSAVRRSHVEPTAPNASA